jgi:hypothetical protein
MEIFIELSNELISIKQEIIESSEIFAQRFGFLLYAIDSGLNIEKSKVLANCYMNKLLYNCVYSDPIEADLAKIIELCPIGP